MPPPRPHLNQLSPPPPRPQACQLALLAAAVRGDHRLHLVEVHAASPDAKLRRRLLNLNANGDDTCSFTVLGLASSPDGRWLASWFDRTPPPV